MRRRGTPADRGCVATSHQIVLGHLQQQHLPFSLCNSVLDFLQPAFASRGYCLGLWMSDSSSDTTHEAILHIQRHLHILLIAVTLATFAIVPVPGQTSIAPIGVRCIGAELMVTVPLESRGGEAKEGEENETLSVWLEVFVLQNHYLAHSMPKV